RPVDGGAAQIHVETVDLGHLEGQGAELGAEVGDSFAFRVVARCLLRVPGDLLPELQGGAVVFEEAAHLAHGAAPLRLTAGERPEAWDDELPDPGLGGLRVGWQLGEELVDTADVAILAPALLVEAWLMVRLAGALDAGAA